MFFDTHCHLNNDRLLPDAEGYIKRANEAGVKACLVVGFNYQSSLDAIALAERFPCVYAAVGIHPNDLLLANKNDFQAIESLLSHPKVVALGEIGLDYYWNEVDKVTQHYYFEYFIQMAYRHQKPIIIHNRNADKDTLDILQKNKAYITKGVMHCYSASKEMVKDFVNTGMYISFAGPLTFLNAKMPKEAAKVVPLDRLLIETDAPYLSPHPFRGQQNESARVVYVAQELACLKEMSVEEIAKITTENACQLFGINYEKD